MRPLRPLDRAIKSGPRSEWEEPVIDPASIAEDLAAECVASPAPRQPTLIWSHRLQSVRRRLGRVEHRVSDLERHSPAKQESHAVPAHSPGMHPPLSAHTPGTSLASTHYSDRPDHPVTTEEAEAVLVMESLSTSNNMCASLPRSMQRRRGDHRTGSRPAHSAKRFLAYHKCE